MAKKVRRKAVEEHRAAFEFPEFDERAFLSHEFEQTVAVTVAILVAIGLGVLSWALVFAGIPWFVPVALSLAIVILVPILLPRFRSQARQYTKGEWAGLLMTAIFGWLGFWFLFLNVFGSPA
jgi:Flp pilus assembly protein TadB